MANSLFTNDKLKALLASMDSTILAGLHESGKVTFRLAHRVIKQQAEKRDEARETVEYLLAVQYRLSQKGDVEGTKQVVNAIRLLRRAYWLEEFG